MAGIRQILGSMPVPRTDDIPDPKDRADAMLRFARGGRAVSRMDPDQLTFAGHRAAKTGMVPHPKMLRDLSEGDKRMLYGLLTSKVRSFAPDASGQMTLGLEAVRGSVPGATLNDLSMEDLRTLQAEDVGEDWSEWPLRSDTPSTFGRPDRMATREAKRLLGANVDDLSKVASQIGEAVRMGDERGARQFASDFNKVLADTIMEATKSNVPPSHINRMIKRKLDKDGLRMFRERIEYFQKQNRAADFIHMFRSEKGMAGVRKKAASGLGQGALAAFDKGDYVGAVVRQRLSGLEAELGSGKEMKPSVRKMREGQRQSLERGLNNLKERGMWLPPKVTEIDELTAGQMAEHDEDFYSVLEKEEDPRLARQRGMRDVAEGDYAYSRSAEKFHDDLEIDRKMAQGMRREAPGSERTWDDVSKPGKILDEKLNLRAKLKMGKLLQERKIAAKVLRDGAFRVAPKTKNKGVKAGINYLNKMIRAMEGASDKGGLSPQEAVAFGNAKLLRGASGLEGPATEMDVGTIIKRLEFGAPESFEGVVKNPRIMKILKTLFRL